MVSSVHFQLKKTDPQDPQVVSLTEFLVREAKMFTVMIIN